MGSILNKSASFLVALIVSLIVPAAAPQDGPAELTASISATSTPELPRATVTIEPLPTLSRTITVGASGNLQAAIDAARGGDVIALEAGAQFEGPFRLRNRSDD